MSRLLFLLVGWYTCLSLYAQPYYSNKNDIATVQLFSSNGQLYIQSLPLYRQNELELQLDYVYTSTPNMYYDILLCDENWNVVDEPSSTFLQGQQRTYLFSYDNSIAAYSTYQHYKVKLFTYPTKVLRSGNYLIRIFNNNENGERILSEKRIILYEEKCELNMSAFQTLEKNATKLRATISLKFNEYNNIPENIEGNVKTYLLHNGDWNTWQQIKELPIPVDETTFVYGQTGNLNLPIFPFYRYFENANVNMRGDRVSATQLINNQLTAQIDIDKKIYATFRHPYINFPGYFTVLSSSLGTEVETSAEYVCYHFYLESVESKAPVYIVGLFNDYTLSDSYQMAYNAIQNRYEISLLLKQGHYQYIYVTKKNDAYSLFDVNYIATDQAPQIYSAITYYATLDSKAPRIIGYTNETF